MRKVTAYECGMLDAVVTEYLRELIGGMECLPFWILVPAKLTTRSMLDSVMIPCVLLWWPSRLAWRFVRSSVGVSGGSKPGSRMTSLARHGVAGNLKCKVSRSAHRRRDSVGGECRGEV